MKVVIFGSTGGTGMELIQQALRRGHEVVAVARNPKAISLSSPNLQVAQADVLDPASVQQAVQGADAVISALGVRMGGAPSDARSRGTRHIVDALALAGVRRFVSVSAVGAGAHLQTLPWVARVLLPRIVGAWRLQEAGLQEEAVRASRLDWVVLRAPRLVDGPPTGRVQMGVDLATGFGAKLSRGDLAAALLDQLESNTYLRSMPTVAGA